MLLYHGSSVEIEKPDVTFNTGFSDLGRGFYLTDDREVARARARTRARVDGAECGIVSAYEFDESAVRWVTVGSSEPARNVPDGRPVGVRFAATRAGVVAWANYIRACRRGTCAIEGIGEPEVVRAWIATEDVEMVCSGFAPAEALAEFIDPTDLVVQFCVRSQSTADSLLAFAKSERVSK